jgi:hypothetical protein
MPATLHPWCAQTVRNTVRNIRARISEVGVAACCTLPLGPTQRRKREARASAWFQRRDAPEPSRH